MLGILIGSTAASSASFLRRVSLTTSRVHFAWLWGKVTPSVLGWRSLEITFGTVAGGSPFPLRRTVRHRGLIHSFSSLRHTVLSTMIFDQLQIGWSNETREVWI